MKRSIFRSFILFTIISCASSSPYSDRHFADLVAIRTDLEDLNQSEVLHSKNTNIARLEALAYNIRLACFYSWAMDCNPRCNVLSKTFEADPEPNDREKKLKALQKYVKNREFAALIQGLIQDEKSKLSAFWVYTKSCTPP